MPLRPPAIVVLAALAWGRPAPADSVGYYRQPALAGDTVVFVSEGDLWKVPVAGGTATRLTAHAGGEGLPAVSPDGKTLAFVGRYEGPAEAYTMPLAGGRPRRRTFDAADPDFLGWTPDGKLLVATEAASDAPRVRLVAIDPADDARTVVPLDQAAEGAYDPAGEALIFTRLPFQGSHTRRYKGGTAQNLWRFAPGDDEATPLTADYPGTSKAPMWHGGRVYFASDRDGAMNLWSMTPDGKDLKQHTRHADFELAGPSMSVPSGRVVYQLGADLRVYDVEADRDEPIPIRLESDADESRERWVAKPLEYLTSAHVSPDGEAVALTARGRVFVVPRKEGRLVEAARTQGVRYRDARFLPDGKRLLVLSDESGEVELWTLPSNGVGAGTRLTGDGEVLRWQGVPSPDGRRIAHTDKNQRLFLFDTKTKENVRIAESDYDDLDDLAWSPDSRWLAYTERGENLFRRIMLRDTEDGSTVALTTERYDSYSPAWSPDGKWIYFLSDRNLESVVPSPWGTYQPEPFLDKKTKIYHVALKKGLRSPFAPPDELHPEKDDGKKDEPKKDDEPKEDEPKEDDAEAKDEEGEKEKDEKQKDGKEDGEKKPPAVEIDRDGLAARLIPLPLPPGNYFGLSATENALFWISSPAGERKQALMGAKIARREVEPKTVVPEVEGYELSQDGKTLLIRQKDTLSLVAANPEPADLSKAGVDLSGWALAVEPREEWRQMFVEAWRLERDYFYDRGMHGNDWAAVRAKYLPLVDRVSSRAELSDLLAQMVAELSALHIFVRGGDVRKGTDDVPTATLGADLVRDPARGGYRVARLRPFDPDEPERAGPLARPGVDAAEGDVITMVDGTPALEAPDLGALLRRKAGKQVLLRIQPADPEAEPRDAIVRPIDAGRDADLRYHAWEHTRRLAVEEKGGGRIGYVHLRAMGGGNFAEWARNFYPVFHRQGLIVDVRDNRGGNIDSWIIGRLLRKPWFYWNPRVGKPSQWNMQYAFRGHLVVLCNEFTASDGEAFCEGVKRLGLGTVVGTRTWGGEIWLTSSNVLVDRGIATSAEIGVYGPEGAWLIEGHGVEPDVVVDNPPHATYRGEDAQLDAALDLLDRKIAESPVETPPPPPFPKKAGDAEAAGN